MSQYSEDLTPDKLSVVTPAADASAMPQFATAEYAHIPGTERCRICNNLISGEYYRVNNQMACATCAQQARAGQPTDSHAAFIRGLLLGAGGALVGFILYATVAIVTGWTIGYLALAVGWLVGKGMIKGSNGLGGRRYQIAAVVLTYAAISLAEIPIVLSHVFKDPNVHISLVAVLVRFWPRLLWRGLASPFLALNRPVGGAIGLFILFIGLRIAWAMTAAKPLDVDGPYSVGTA